MKKGFENLKKYFKNWEFYTEFWIQSSDLDLDHGLDLNLDLWPDLELDNKDDQHNSKSSPPTMMCCKWSWPWMICWTPDDISLTLLSREGLIWLMLAVGVASLSASNNNLCINLVCTWFSAVQDSTTKQRCFNFQSLVQFLPVREGFRKKTEEKMKTVLKEGGCLTWITI